MSWLSRRWDAVVSNVSKAANAVGNGVSSAASATWDAVKDPVGTVKAAKNAIVNGVESVVDGAADVAKTIGKGIEKVADKVESGRQWAVDKVAYAINNPGEVADAAWNGVKTAAIETKNFTVYAVKNPDRAMVMVTQGATDALASTVGMVGDLGVLAYNYGIRPLTNLQVNAYKAIANGALGFVGLDGSVEGDRDLRFSKEPVLGYLDADCAGYLIKRGEELNTFCYGGAQYLANKHLGTNLDLSIEPKNGYEKTMRYGTRAVGEIGAFVGITVLTAGAGGAAMAGARGGAYAARGARAASLMSRMVGAGEDATILARTFRAAATAAGDNPVLGRAVYNGVRSTAAQLEATIGTKGAVAATGGFTGMNFKSAWDEGLQRVAVIDQPATQDIDPGQALLAAVEAENAAVQARLDALMGVSGKGSGAKLTETFSNNAAAPAPGSINAQSPLKADFSRAGTIIPAAPVAEPLQDVAGRISQAHTPQTLKIAG